MLFDGVIVSVALQFDVDARNVVCLQILMSIRCFCVFLQGVIRTKNFKTAPTRSSASGNISKCVLAGEALPDFLDRFTLADFSRNSCPTKSYLVHELS